MSKFLLRILLALSVACGAVGMTTPAWAGDTDPLFVNLTSDDGHRANMGISFGKSQLVRGHPLTIFLNDRAVHIGSKANAGKFAEHQKALSDLMAKGATVLICPMCMKHYSIQQGGLLGGFKVGNPQLTGAALFRDNTKTMTW